MGKHDSECLQEKTSELVHSLILRVTAILKIFIGCLLCFLIRAAMHYNQW